MKRRCRVRAVAVGAAVAGAGAGSRRIASTSGSSRTGMYMAEQQAAASELRPRGAGGRRRSQLGYGDLRAIIDGRRLPGNFDLHLDGRVRISGEFSTDAATQGADQITARGYLGGREYEAARRRGCGGAARASTSRSGACIVPEADALKIDGVRLWWRMAKHWDASIYAGAYPDPYSRSLTTDYAGGFAFAGGARRHVHLRQDLGLARRQQLVSRRQRRRRARSIRRAGVMPQDGDAAHLDHLDRLRALRVLVRRVHRPRARRDGRGRRAAHAARRAGDPARRQAPDVPRRLRSPVGIRHRDVADAAARRSRRSHRRGRSRTTSSSSAPRATRCAATPISASASCRSSPTGAFASARSSTLSEDPQFQGVNGQLVMPGHGLRRHRRRARPRLTRRASAPACGSPISRLSLAQRASSGSSFGRSFLDDRLNVDLSFVYAGTNDATSTANNATALPCTLAAVRC